MTDLHALMSELGESGTSNRLNTLIQKGQTVDTPAGAALAGKIAGKLVHALDEHRKKSPGLKGNAKRVQQMLSSVGKEAAAVIATHAVLDALFKNKSTQPIKVRDLRTIIGNRVKAEMEFRIIKKLEPVKYAYSRVAMQSGSKSASNTRRAFRRDHMSLIDDQWDRRDCYLLGHILVDLLISCTDVVVSTTESMHPFSDFRRKAQPVQVLRLAPDVMEWITKVTNAVSTIKYSHLPMATPPLDWGPGVVGGYDQHVPGLDSLVTARHRDQRYALDKSDCPDVYQAVNTLQRTPWRVNKRVAEMVRCVREQRWPELKLIADVRPFPTKPKHDWEKNDKDWLQYRRDKYAFNREETEQHKDMLEVSRTLATLRIMSEFSRFYFVHRIDFRGRLYPLCSTLSYQGSDYQRASLEFADGKEINSPEALEWLKVHGANCFGVDKVPTADRVKWINENIHNIMAVDADPIDNRWWTEADKPFCFLAFCFDFAGYIKDGEAHRSHLPVAMDGSNNGLQIYSLLLRDPVGGSSTNCVPSDTVADIYQDVADRTTDRLRQYVNGKDREKARKAKEFLAFCKSIGCDGLPRAAAKRPVMTLAYGATRYSCQKYLSEWYHEYIREQRLFGDDTPFSCSDSYQVLYWIGTVVWEAIAEVVVKAREAMEWMHRISDILAEHQLQVSWTSPLGLVCTQRYVRGKIKTTHLHSQGRRVKLQYWEDDGEVKATKARSGFCPNYVHSLDAAAMMKTALWASESGVTHFQMIHDSFATHAADAATLAADLRSAYVSIFSNDLLSVLRDEIASQLPEDVEIPPVPSFGDLQINELNSSEYFFK